MIKITLNISKNIYPVIFFVIMSTMLKMVVFINMTLNVLLSITSRLRPPAHGDLIIEISVSFEILLVSINTL